MVANDYTQKIEVCKNFNFKDFFSKQGRIRTKQDLLTFTEETLKKNFMFCVV